MEGCWSILLLIELGSSTCYMSACVGLNSVRRDILSSVTIVFYDTVRGRNKAQTWLLFASSFGALCSAVTTQIVIYHIVHIYHLVWGVPVFVLSHGDLCSAVTRIPPRKQPKNTSPHLKHIPFSLRCNWCALH